MTSFVNSSYFASRHYYFIISFLTCIYSNQRFYVCDLHLCGDAGLFVVVVR